MTPFLHASARAFLLVHAVVGFAAVGAATHLATYSVGIARGREPWRGRARLFGLLVPALFLAAFVVGLMLYPAWRIDVRAAVLDARSPATSAAFELKEHLAALTLPFLGGAAALALWPRTRETRWMAATLAVAAATLIWTVALVGLYVAAVRAVGGLS